MVARNRLVLEQFLTYLTRPRTSTEDGLLQRFVATRDEAAFAEILHRHGPMVLGLCRRIIGDAHTAEDVFQATFLVLARKAASIRKPEALGAWLHGTALRLARRAGRARHRRQECEAQAPQRSAPDPLDELSAREYLELLDAELQALPESYRLPLILCGLEGLSQEEAARRLGWTPGSVKGRLERGRARLRQRLERRGLAVPAVLAGSLLAVGTTQAVPPTLAAATLQATLSGAGLSPAALTLAQGLIRTFFLGRLACVGAVLLMVGTIGFGFGLKVLKAPGGMDSPIESSKASVTLPSPDPPPGGKRKDRHGDPLPEGAVQRLGTLQRRAVDAELAITPDGASIVSVRGGKYVSIWDAASGRLSQTRELPSHKWNLVSLSPDGRWLVTDDAQTGGVLVVWDIMMAQPVHKFTIKEVGFITPAVLSPDGKKLAAVGNKNKKYVRVWDLTTGKEIFAREVNTGSAPGALVFSPDSNRLLASFMSVEDGGVFCWDISTGQQLWQNKNNFPYELAITPDGKVLLSTEFPNPVLDLATGQPLKQVALPTIEANDRLAITTDGRVLLAAGSRGLVVWDLIQGKELLRLAGAGNRFSLAPDGRTVVTNNGSLQRWEFATGKPLYAETSGDGHVAEVTQVVFSGNGRGLVSGARDGTVRYWEVTTGLTLQNWQAHEKSRSGDWDHLGVDALDISHDGRWVLSAGLDHLKLWNTHEGQEVCALVLPDPERRRGGRPVFHARLLPGEGQAVSLSGGNKITTWDLRAGRLLRCQTIPATEKKASALAPNGQMLLSKGALIKAESGQECGRLEGFEYHHDLPCAFSSDSRLVASDSVRHEPRLVCPGGVRIWEAATGKAVAHLKTPSWVTQLVFSPDNRLLATNALDGIKLWDLATGQVVFRREMPEKVRSRITSGTYAGCLAFSPDGRRLATGHPDSTILIWEVILPARNPVSARPRELEALWADLSEKDAARAWQAVWRMGELPKETIPFLGQRVQPLRPTPEEVTRPLLAQLDDDSYQRREAATKRLKDLGHQAGPALSTALKGDPTPEKKQRLEMLLQVLAEAPAFSSPKELQELRAVAVLERVDSPEARALLQELAKGIPSAPLTRHAQAAQKRSH